MISPEEARFIRRRAYVPEHAVGMMSLISGAEPFLIRGYLCFARDPWVIAIGYPLDAASAPPALEQLVAALVERFRPEQLWCIAPEIPDALDASAVERESDRFYTLSLDGVAPEAALPRAPRRAARELTVERARTLGPAHSALIAEFLEQEKPPPRVSALFRSMADYVPRSDSAVVLTARDRGGAPVAFYVVELEAESFATYVIGCRSREHPVPGASDLLFVEMLELARRHGKRFVHLGLGVNDGIRAFKAKWGGTPSIRYEFRALRCRAPAMLASLVARLQR